MKQIIAMGGGGFSMEPENSLLDKYILEQAGKKTPKICFIPTASGDADGYIERFYESFRKLDCYPAHLSLFSPNFPDLEEYVLMQDILYVGGGNTRNMLVLWREWGLDTILRKAYEQGMILAGLSAGSNCWFEEGHTDPINAPLRKIDCLGFLPGSHCPHYNGEEERRPSYKALVGKGEMKPGYAVDDSCALHFIDGELERAVSSKPEAKAYTVNAEGGFAVETELATVYLGR